MLATPRYRPQENYRLFHKLVRSFNVNFISTCLYPSLCLFQYQFSSFILVKKNTVHLLQVLHNVYWKYDFERMFEDDVLGHAYFKVLCQGVSGGGEQKHEKSQSREAYSCLEH
jgi:hypothetical protein